MYAYYLWIFKYYTSWINMTFKIINYSYGLNGNIGKVLHHTPNEMK